MNAERFINALHQCESQHSPDPLLELFTDDIELQRLKSDEPYRGLQGARDFWNEYLALFNDLRSEFKNVIEAPGFAVLEWTTTGHFQNGAPVSYRGVSILEFQGDRVRRFRTYYDSAVFTQSVHA